MPAATSAPNAISEDHERHGQREQACTLEVLAELLVDLLLSADAELVDPQRGVRRGRRVDGLQHGSIRSTAVSASPLYVEVHDRRVAVRRNLARVADGVRARMSVTTRPRRGGGRRRRPPRGTRDRRLSASGSGRALSRPRAANPLSRILVARPDSPGRVSLLPSCFVPSAPPITTAATTNASQPKIADLPVAGAPTAHPGRDVAAALQR